MISYGYAWVPEGLDGINDQIEAFHRFGIGDDRIYQDEQAGVVKERKELRRLIKKCKKDDLIFIKNLDRLGSSYDQLRDNWIEITSKNGINICVIDSPMIDTRRDSELVSSIVLSMLDYVNTTSKTGSARIQAERIKAAMNRGVKFGRPKWQPDDEFIEVYLRFKKGELSLTTASIKLGIPKSTFRYRVKVYEER
jgi:DNA invertase Pin-like site-specific DNA recombinase